MPAAVPWLPVRVLRPLSRPCSSNRISPSCLGEPRLNARPASRYASASSSAMRALKSADSSCRICGSTLMPRCSIAASTATSGRSMVS